MAARSGRIFASAKADHRPPGASGAFYSVLDALVAATMLLLSRRMDARNIKAEYMLSHHHV